MMRFGEAKDDQTIRIVALIGVAVALFCSLEAQGQTIVAQNWIDGWNSTDPEKLVAAFTPEGVYEDVAFGITKKGSAELRDLHKFFHNALSGLY
jgi:hypothetical protein